MTVYCFSTLEVSFKFTYETSLQSNNHKLSDNNNMNSVFQKYLRAGVYQVGQIYLDKILIEISAEWSFSGWNTFWMNFFLDKISSEEIYFWLKFLLKKFSFGWNFSFDEFLFGMKFLLDETLLEVFVGWNFFLMKFFWQNYSLWIIHPNIFFLRKNFQDFFQMKLWNMTCMDVKWTCFGGIVFLHFLISPTVFVSVFNYDSSMGHSRFSKKMEVITPIIP